jgi:RNA recognition motif-containing protein
METELYVRNLPQHTRAKELSALFAQAGDVAAINIISDRLTGECKGYAFITMSAQSEADKAISLFNMYSLKDHRLRVTLVKPREQRGFHPNY